MAAAGPTFAHLSLSAPCAGYKNYILMHTWHCRVIAAKDTRLDPIAFTAVAILTAAIIAAPYWDQAPYGSPVPSVALASPDVSAKFDDGFYDKIRGWIAGAGAGGAAGGASGAAANSEPELEVLVGGKPAPPLIEGPVSAAPATVSLRATDAEGEAVRFSLWTAGEGAPVSLTDHGNGTATLTVTVSAPGEHPFEVAVSDAHGEEWAPHILRIVPATPALPVG